MNNPPAFPHVADILQWDGKSTTVKTLTQNGMTLRDYFAAQALTGAQIWDAVINGKNAQFSASTEKLAEVAYEIADAMLEARK
jgi:hypothetical protein